MEVTIAEEDNGLFISNSNANSGTRTDEGFQASASYESGEKNFTFGIKAGVIISEEKK